jgi:hypothetical protein
MIKKNWRKPILKVLSIGNTKNGEFNDSDGFLEGDES